MKKIVLLTMALISGMQINAMYELFSPQSIIQKKSSAEQKVRKLSAELIAVCEAKKALLERGSNGEEGGFDDLMLCDCIKREPSLRDRLRTAQQQKLRSKRQRCTII